MRYCLFLLLCAAYLPVTAQVFVNKVNVNDRPIQYVEVWEKFNKSSGKFFVMLDYGQEDDLKDREGKGLHLTNEEGQYIEFNGMVDALNFMYRNGWEVLQPKTTHKIQSYLLKQREGYVNNTVKQTKNKTVTSTSKSMTSTKEKMLSANKDKAEKSIVEEVQTEAAPEEIPIPSVKVTRLPK